MKNEPEVDESLLSPQEKEGYHKPLFRYQWLIVWGILLVLIAICAVVIAVLS